MSFTKITGHISHQNPEGVAKVLFKTVFMNAEQMKLVAEIKAHYNGETVLTRKQLRDAHGVLRGRKASPYFVCKNLACKVKDKFGYYDISRLKLSKAAEKQLAQAVAQIEAPAVENVEAPVAPVKKARAKKESAPKKEATAKKRGGKKAIEAPANVEAENVEVNTSIEQSVPLESFDL